MKPGRICPFVSGLFHLAYRFQGSSMWWHGSVLHSFRRLNNSPLDRAHICLPIRYRLPLTEGMMCSEGPWAVFVIGGSPRAACGPGQEGFPPGLGDRAAPQNHWCRLLVNAAVCFPLCSQSTCHRWSKLWHLSAEYVTVACPTNELQVPFLFPGVAAGS